MSPLARPRAGEGRLRCIYVFGKLSSFTDNELHASPHALLVPPHIQLENPRRRLEPARDRSRTMPTGLLVKPCRTFIPDRARKPRDLDTRRRKARLTLRDQPRGSTGAAPRRRHVQLIKLIAALQHANRSGAPTGPSTRTCVSPLFRHSRAKRLERAQPASSAGTIASCASRHPSRHNRASGISISETSAGLISHQKTRANAVAQRNI